MWPFKKKEGQPKAGKMTLENFLKLHPGHQVVSVQDIVAIQCLKCNEAFYMPAKQWAEIVARNAPTVASAKSPVTPAIAPASEAQK